eukprot:CAMPEP_0182487280 /NCGR_PEP_ID=MMETSP1319-20130603/47824_1 /TAXON_ID=172717 /ORGANISM="Bolidomonas pacifica, Strain RCC208" /LENGTH=74 /DNA_ID=CAMNT_0024689395 /DNA_START=913 /DNA_END=1133 /DNA_ORIENTATION=-
MLGPRRAVHADRKRAKLQADFKVASKFGGDDFDDGASAHPCGPGGDDTPEETDLDGGGESPYEPAPSSLSSSAP